MGFETIDIYIIIVLTLSYMNPWYDVSQASNNKTITSINRTITYIFNKKEGTPEGDTKMKELQSQPYERLHTCLQENQGSTMVLTATTLCSDIAVDFQEN